MRYNKLLDRININIHQTKVLQNLSSMTHVFLLLEA